MLYSLTLNLNNMIFIVISVCFPVNVYSIMVKWKPDVVKVTDTRYVSRNVQFICCCEQPVMDTCIYLNDITELREVRGDTACSNLCCEDCCQCWPCLCCCRLMIPKRLQFRGSFGSHTTHIYRNDQADFELMITEAIAQHKLLN